MNILFFGDVVGKPGRNLLIDELPKLRAKYDADAVVVNGENAAEQGVGISPEVADAFISAGVDVITTGNHVYRRREIYDYLERQARIVRPYNFLPSNPGRGVTVVETKGGRLGVINLSGQLFLHVACSPFEVVDEALEQLEGVRNVLVDLHGEATSEKVAMGHYLDGRVSAVVGTHTHVRTADARVLPGGTAYITDAGMCGPRDSVIGVKKEAIIERFLTQMPTRFDPATGDVWLEGVLIRLSGNGKAQSIELVESSGTTEIAY